MQAVARGGVLFLDLSTSIGFCYGTAANVPAPGPIWGVWKLPNGPELGRRLVAAENELCDAIDRWQPAKIGIEAPLPAGQQTHAHTAELVICLAGMVEATAYRWERQFVQRASNTLRSAVCGRSRRSDDEKDDRVSIKDAVVKPWIVSMGWKITEHDAADAAVGWAYEMGLRAPGRK